MKGKYLRVGPFLRVGPSLIWSTSRRLFSRACIRLQPYLVWGWSAGVSSVARDRSNAAALAKALYTAIAIPMLLCCLIYSLLYRTYPRDRERARMDSLITSVLQHIELERCHGIGDFYAGREDATVIDIEYGEEELDANDDEKALMHHQVEQSGSLR